LNRFIAVLAAVGIGLPAFAAWSVRPDTVKVVVKKATHGKAAGRSAVAGDVMQRHHAAVVFDGAGSIVLQVPRGRAEQLTRELAPNADSVEVREELDRIGFLSFPIDVRAGAPAYPEAWRNGQAASLNGRDAFVVQFAAAPQKEWIDAMVQSGLRIISYIPENAYVVYGKAVDVESVRERFPVQFVARHEPVHRITPELRTQGGESIDVTVVVADVPEAAASRALLAAHTIETLQPVTPAGDRELHRVRVKPSALRALANSPAVIWIEPAPEVKLSGEREVYLSSGDTLTTKSGTLLRPAAPVNYRTWLSGKGVSNYTSAVKVGMLDSGFDNGTTVSPHFDFRNAAGSFVETVDYTLRKLGTVADCYGHGTAVAGVIAGNAGSAYGTSTRDIGSSFGDYDYLMGLGIAPAIPLVTGRIFNYNAGSGTIHYEPEPFTTIFPDLAGRQVKITNNSWNDTTLTNAGRYTTDAQTLDRIVRKVNNNDTGDPMALYFSIGNTESYLPVNPPETRAQPPATAKNVVAMGGTESYNPISTYPVRDQFNAGVHASNGFDHFVQSTRGTTDSRFKPDLMAPATAMEAPRTTSTVACYTTVNAVIGPVLDPAEPANKQHIWSRGTSFSSPGGVGNAALLYTWFKNKTTLAPSPAMLKAMQVTFAQSLATLPNAPEVRQGFGKIDLTQAFKTDGRYAWSDQTSSTVLTPSNFITWLPTIMTSYRIKDITRPVRVTLVWTDRAGDPAAANALVNDLHLIVYPPSGAVTAVGNSFNATTGRSNMYASGAPPSYDRRNNVEQVVFNSTDIGQYFRVDVWGETITGDALNPWNGTTPQQDFALFIENVIGQ
jgi:hypothetical protein